MAAEMSPSVFTWKYRPGEAQFWASVAICGWNGATFEL